MFLGQRNNKLVNFSVWNVLTQELHMRGIWAPDVVWKKSWTHACRTERAHKLSSHRGSSSFFELISSYTSIGTPVSPAHFHPPHSRAVQQWAAIERKCENWRFLKCSCLPKKVLAAFSQTSWSKKKPCRWEIGPVSFAPRSNRRSCLSSIRSPWERRGGGDFQKESCIFPFLPTF